MAGRAGGRREWEELLNEFGVFLAGGDNVLRLDRGGACIKL